MYGRSDLWYCRIRLPKPDCSYEWKIFMSIRSLNMSFWQIWATISWSLEALCSA